MKKKTVLWGLGIAGAIAATFWLNAKYLYRRKTAKKTLTESLPPLPKGDCNRLDIDEKIH